MRSLRRRLLAAGLSAALVGGAGSLVVVSRSASAAFSAGPFGAPVVVSGTDTGEPGIDVAPDGTLYVNAPAGLLSNLPGAPSFVWRSTDAGATWTLTPASLRANLPGGGDSDISVDGSGKLYMTDLWLGSATVSTSSDRGQTWVADPTNGVVVQDRQWIAATGGGVAYHVTHQIPVGLVVSKSVDGGVTYPVQSVAATAVDQTGCICPPGVLIASGTGAMAGLSDKVGVIYATSTGGVKFAHSANGGLTFANSVVSPSSSADTSLAFPVVASNGGSQLSAVWLEVSGGTSVVRFAQSPDWGQTWGAPRTLVSTGANVYPWVAAAGSKVAVTVYHTDTSGTPDSAPPGAQWFESYLESVDGGSTFSSLTTVDPTPVKSGPICTGGTNCSADRELLDFQSVAIDPAGRTNAVWTRSVDNVSDTEIRFARQT
jgi:hypothetical protein